MREIRPLLNCTHDPASLTPDTSQWHQREQAIAEGYQMWTSSLPAGKDGPAVWTCVIRYHDPITQAVRRAFAWSDETGSGCDDFGSSSDAHDRYRERVRAVAEAGRSWDHTDVPEFRVAAADDAADVGWP